MKQIEELDFTKKKYIIFDLDGTLIDSVGIWNQSDFELIKQYSGREIDLNMIQNDRDHFLENTTEQDTYIAYCNYLMEKYHFYLEADELLRVRREISSKLLINEVNYKEGAPEILHLLKDMGYILVLATVTTNYQLNIYSNLNKRMLEQVDMQNMFDLILSKEDVEKKKPNPEIYYKILKYYQAKPEECLIFEDSLHGIIAANKAFIEVVNVYDQYSDKDRGEIDKRTDYKIETFHQLKKNLSLKTIGENL